VIFDDAAGCDYCLPTPTEADAGKVVTVNSAGDGYTNEEAAGGSFDCDDLLGCDIFTGLQEQVENIGKIVSVAENTSIPPVHFGLLYNGACIFDSPGLAPVGWQVASYSQWTSLFSYVGGRYGYAGLLMTPSLFYWISLPENANNLYLFNARGAGRFINRSNPAEFKQHNRFHTGTAFSSYPASYYAYISSSNNELRAAALANGMFNLMSVRLTRLAPGKADGTVGTCVYPNGHVYRTVVINEIEWLADNLAEFSFIDGSTIPYYVNPPKGNELPACAAPDSDIANV
jgi:uncharacterized protein (TIGR02145 family)